jgi:hypothetical protein
LNIPDETILTGILISRNDSLGERFSCVMLQYEFTARRKTAVLAVELLVYNVNERLR